MREHTEKCMEWQRSYDQEIAAFAAKYPNYCRACGGTGIVSYQENLAPHGEGPWMHEMQDACEACFGKCPRCGRPLPDDDAEVDSFYAGELACGECGFTVGKQGQDSAPYQLECLCGMWDEEEATR